MSYKPLALSAFARHRDALRRRAADTTESPPSRTWGLFLAFLGVICVSPDSMLLRSMYGSECALIGLLENILAPLWVSVWKSTSVSGA